MGKDFTKAENKVLTEIYRRLSYFHNGNVNENLLLLTTPSRAKLIKKYGLIKPFSTEYPRQYCWYNLTERGKFFFRNYPSIIFKISTEENDKMFNGESIIKFDKTLINFNIKH